MPTMQDVRAKYPQYEDMDDASLADALHRKFYADMPRAEFDARLGLSPSEPSQPRFGEMGMNATAGANEAIYGALGAPVDLARGAMNLGIRGFNAATGSEVGQIPENSFGGSRFIAETMGAVRPELDPRNTQAASAEERIARGVGQGAAGAVVPAAAVAAAGRAGVIAPHVAEMGAQAFGRANTVRSVGAEAVTGAAAGLGASSVMEASPDALKPYAGLAGGIVGGGLGMAATGIPGLAREGYRLGTQYAEPMHAAGRQQIAGRTLRERATDPEAAMDAIETAPRQLVPGSQPTTFQLTGDMGLGSLERGSQTRFPAEFGQRRADQNTARVGALESIQPGGAPERVAQSVRGFLQQIDDDTMAALTGAQERARTGAAGLGAGSYPDDAGAAMRGAIETARAHTKDQERALWSAVDPDGTLALSPASVRQQAAETIRTLPASAKPPSGEEAAILGVLGQYGETVPFSEFTALSSRLKAEMRAERMANGETPAYARMARLAGALQNDLDGAVAGRVQQEAQAVAEGRLAPENTTEALLQRQVEAWFAERTQAGAAGGNGPQGFVGGGPVRPSAASRLPGAGSEAQRGLPSTSGDPRLSRSDLDPGSFDRAAQDRLTAANAATRERVSTFDNRLLAPFRRQSATDLPHAAVARRIFSGTPESFEAIQTYRRAVGDAEASATITPYAIGQARRAALNEDGTFDPLKLDRWRRQHADALRAFPDLDARLADVNRMSVTVGDAVAARRQQMDAAQRSALGRFVQVDTPEETTRLVGGLLSRQDGPRQLAEIRRAIGEDVEALQGLRKAAADFITMRLIGNTEVGTSGQTAIRSDQYQTFMRQNESALRTIFSDEEVRNMAAVAADLQRSARSQNAVRIPGQSNTAQDTFELRGDETPGSALAKIVATAGPAGVGVGVAGGPVVGSMAAAGAAWSAALREGGFRKVDELVRDALLNPDLAQSLMTGVRREGPASERELARRFRASLAATGALALDGDDEPAAQRMPIPLTLSPMPLGDGQDRPQDVLAGPRAERPLTNRERLVEIMMEVERRRPPRSPSPAVQRVMDAMLTRVAA